MRGPPNRGPLEILMMIRWLPDWVRTSIYFAQVPQIHHILSCVVKVRTFCHTIHFATFADVIIRHAQIWGTAHCV